MWPNLGLHWALTAKIASVTEDSKQAIDAAWEAIKIFRHTHPDSIVMDTMYDLMRGTINERYSREDDSYEDYYSL